MFKPGFKARLLAHGQEAICGRTMRKYSRNCKNIDCSNPLRTVSRAISMLAATWLSVLGFSHFECLVLQKSQTRIIELRWILNFSPMAVSSRLKTICQSGWLEFLAGLAEIGQDRAGPVLKLASRAW